MFSFFLRAFLSRQQNTVSGVRGGGEGGEGGGLASVTFYCLILILSHHRQNMTIDQSDHTIECLSTIFRRHARAAPRKNNPVTSHSDHARACIDP